MLRKVNTNYKISSNILFTLKITSLWSRVLGSCQPDCWTSSLLNYRKYSLDLYKVLSLRNIIATAETRQGHTVQRSDMQEHTHPGRHSRVTF